MHIFLQNTVVSSFFLVLLLNLVLLFGCINSNQNSGKAYESVLVQLKPLDIEDFKPKARTSNYQEMHDVYSVNLVQQLQQHADNTQNRLLQYLESEKQNGNVQYIQSYYISNTIAIKAKRSVLNNIKTFDIVEEIVPNKKFSYVQNKALNHNLVLEDDVDWTGSEVHWSIDFINATNLNEQVYERASSLLYANADTGVDFEHPALFKNYAGIKQNGSVSHDYSWWDANKIERTNEKNIKCGVNVKHPCPDDEHGTHTMSTAVGLQGLGVSPTTKWIACKNMDNNLGSPESYLGCLQFFLAPTNLDGSDPRPDLRPHVVGNSYGCPSSEGCEISVFKYALLALKKAGIFMSVSAGNDGSKGCETVNSPPAVDPNSFTVAASNYKSIKRAYFSSMGPSIFRNVAIDITAPGVNITGAIPGNKYASFQGTSMASPHVSGAALLVIAGCPHLSRRVDEIADVLRKTATPIKPKVKCGSDKNDSVPNNVIKY